MKLMKLRVKCLMCSNRIRIWKIWNFCAEIVLELVQASPLKNSPQITHLRIVGFINFSSFWRSHAISTCRYTVDGCNAVSRCSFLSVYPIVVSAKNCLLNLWFWVLEKISPYQIAVSYKSSATHVTFKVLTSRMTSNMYGKLSLTCKCHRTSITA